MTTVLDRFLSYVAYDTQSDESSQTYPSTERQLVLLRDLTAELRGLGLTDAAVHHHFGSRDALIDSVRRFLSPD